MSTCPKVLELKPVVRAHHRWPTTCGTQLPHGAPFSHFFGEGFSFNLDQPTQDFVFPRGHQVPSLRTVLKGSRKGVNHLEGNSSQKFELLTSDSRKHRDRLKSPSVPMSILRANRQEGNTCGQDPIELLTLLVESTGRKLL